MEIDKIRTPQDVFTYMDENISYGWLDVNHKIHGIKEMTNFRSLYRTMSVEETVKHGVGTCVEQVALISVPVGISFREFNAYINHQEILHSREDVS